MNRQELTTYIERLSDLMVSVSTGGLRIEEADDTYKALYMKVTAELEDKGMPNKNSYSSLWDYYSYWSKELPTYQSRREYIRSLYKEILDKLHLEEEKKKIVERKENKGYTFKFEDLHEDILIRCKDHFLSGKYDDAIMNAGKVLEDKIRNKAELKLSDIGIALVNKAFAPENTKFMISEDTGEVRGWQNLFSGVIGVFKNPNSHRFIDETDPVKTFKILILFSLLLDMVDNLQVKEDDFIFEEDLAF